MQQGKPMKTFTATELKNKTSEALETAAREPVTIMKNGRSVAVILSQADYQRLSELENAYWRARAAEAEAEGYVGTNATAIFLKEMNAKYAKGRSD